MRSLIELTKCDDGMRVSSKLISEHTGTSYKATNNLIRKHKKRMKSLGELPFQKAVDSKSGRAKPALLNEDQAIFLLTLSRNSEQVVEFKLALTKEFGRLRRKEAQETLRLADLHGKVEWQQNRELGKLSRRDITNTIQRFIVYATAQGSRSASRYFMVITKAVNSALGVDDRDSIDEESLHLLATAELIVERSLQQGMTERLPYKTIYQLLKAEMADFLEMTQDVCHEEA